MIVSMYVEMSVQNYIMDVCLIDYYDIHIIRNVSMYFETCVSTYIQLRLIQRLINVC